MILEEILNNLDIGICGEWQRAVGSHGYGAVRFGGRVRTTHSVVYEELVGEYEGELDHVCRNKSCANPDHLEPVTRVVNAMRARGTERHMPCGHSRQMTGNRHYSTSCSVCYGAR